jgi:hypothetical protein
LSGLKAKEDIKLAIVTWYEDQQKRNKIISKEINFINIKREKMEIEQIIEAFKTNIDRGVLQQ